MSKGRAVVAILLVAAVALYFVLRKPALPGPATGGSANEIHPAAAPTPTPAAPPNNQAPTAANPAPVAGGIPASNLADRAGVVTPPSTNVPNLSVAVIVGNVSHAIHDYNAMFGGNPVGTNPEITRALNGNNPKHINFIRPEDGMTVNDQGELVDPWGTPLFFHQLSAKDTEVRSAGKDKIMWTEDDIISR